MPKINVYLPDELAEAVKATGIPVSAICQRALEQAVRRVTAIRETVLGDLDDAALAARLPHFTARVRTVLRLAAERATAERAPAVGTAHLLTGIVAEGGNLALHVLRAIDIEPPAVAAAMSATPEPAEPTHGHRPSAPAAATNATPEPAEPTHGRRPNAPAAATNATPQPAEPAHGRRFSAPAAAALELAVTEATALGHNYVGCEHLLLGLVAEPDGAAGQALRALGAELRLTRRAVTAALAGYVHLQAQSPTLESALAPLLERIERLEQRLR
ncbi:Clp protease N-terminal domain-containing protein [Dactylosporangium sp. CA-052675]|uniref:Clp protease N-terminal domain-containing protein n=1 Tax=Dactylosporangium sp. CA-052675 TaxID=3239927 RepID=UPI003D8D63A2